MATPLLLSSSATMFPLPTLRAWLSQRFRPKSLGQRGEDKAIRYLRGLGYRILARGHDSGLGELDIIAADGRTIVFVEVKTRRSTAAGHPAESIDRRKQRRMSQAALAYLKSKRLLSYSARFDVVALTWPEAAIEPTIEHFRNAFEPIGRGQLYR